MRGHAKRQRGAFAWAIPLAVLAASTATVVVIGTQQESGVEVSAQVPRARPLLAPPGSTVTAPGRDIGHQKPKAGLTRHHGGTVTRAQRHTVDPCTGLRAQPQTNASRSSR